MVREFTPQEVADMEAAAAAAEVAHGLAGNPNADARTALSDALALADLYPAPTPEETALIDAQVAGALALYRALDNPPADVVSLAVQVQAMRFASPDPLKGAESQQWLSLVSTNPLTYGA